MEDKNEGLGISINAQVEKAHQGLQDIVKQLNLTGKSIVKTQQLVKDGSLTKYIGTIKDGLATVTTQIDGTGKELKRTVTLAKGSQKTFSQLFDVGKLYLYWNLTKRIRTTIKGWVTSAIDYQETVNKFNVSMGSSVQYATRFQNKLSETFGIAKAEMMDYQATFKNILSGLGDLSTKTTEQISETLVKMGLDYSSLFNVSQSGAMEKLQSALTGSIVPIRKDSGYDVSNLTIVAKAQELGVDKTSAQLTQMEKRILKIIVLMEQMKRTGAFQDLARTIESPSNQIKVLQNQLHELGVWLGNVFTGVLGSVLPYINGFVMALKEIIKVFAIFVGYEETATGLDDVFKVVDDDVGGIAEGLGSANKSAKELKRTLMGFDVLNVIQTPTESSGGGGTGAGSGVGSIDPKILGALKNYDSLMGKVRMKATKIRDAIMEWLGFTKKINPLTGEVFFEAKQGLTNFRKILEAIKAIGIALGTWKVSSKISNLLKNLGIMGKAKAFKLSFGLTLAVTGIYLAYKGITHLMNGDVDLFTVLETFLGLGAGTFGIINLLKLSKRGQSLGLLKQIGISFGITLAITSLSVLLDGINKGSVEQQIFGALGLAGSGASIGGSIGGLKGAVIGFTVGLAVTGLVEIGNYISRLDETQQKLKQQREEWAKIGEECDKLNEEWNNIVEEAQTRINTNEIEMQSAERLAEQLEILVDANGKVKKGNEDRVRFILNQLNTALDTEYQLTGNQITQNGKLYDSYDKIEKEIYNVIDAKRAQAQYEANESVYKEAVNNSQKYYDAMMLAKKANDEAYDSMVGFYNYYTDVNRRDVNKTAYILKRYNVEVEDIINNTKKWQDALATMNRHTRRQLEKEAEAHRKNLQQTGDKYKETQKTVDESLDAIVAHEQLGTALITKDQEKIAEALEKVQSNYDGNTSSFVNRVGRIIYESNREKEFLKQNGVEITKEQEAQYDARLKAVAENLSETTKTIEDMSDDQKEAWKLIATESYDIYKQELKKLDPTVQQEIKKLVGSIEKETPNASNASSKLASSVSNAFKNEESKIKNTTKSISDVINKNLNGVFSVKFGLQADYSTLKRKLKDIRDTIGKMASVPGTGVIFAGLRNGLDGLIAQLSVKGYADGGTPQIGELFLARESGAELVGNIGNKTAVMNNDQIVQAVSQGVAQAVSQVMSNNQSGASYNLYLDGKQLTDVVQERISRNAMIAGI